MVSIINEDNSVKTYETALANTVIVQKGDRVNIGDVLFSGSFINNVFYVDMSRLLLVALFLAICVLISIAYHKRKKTGEI